ncbi:MAG: hypothetical protein HWN81_00155 [Candidatus Lokiarchaeota archaeon]|nr:hypothetical protein [Candidatus Lokiarchaeota archaeon]
MPIIDFHGQTVESSKREVNKLVDDARSCGVMYHCQFITGQGKIKQVLIKLLKDYGFKVFEKIGNPGILKVDIE